MAKLKDIAQEAFKANPKAAHIYVTTDGVPFLNKNAADLHASTNPKGKKLEVKTFSQEEKENTGSKPSAAERIATISKLETVADVQKALEGENATTVKKAGKERIEALNIIAKSGTNSPETRGNKVADATKEKSKEETTIEDYTQVATYDELMQFVEDNEVALPNGRKKEDVRTAVIAYLENPNKVIVPFKAID